MNMMLSHLSLLIEKAKTKFNTKHTNLISATTVKQGLEQAAHAQCNPLTMMTDMLL